MTIFRRSATPRMRRASRAATGRRRRSGGAVSGVPAARTRIPAIGSRKRIAPSAPGRRRIPRRSAIATSRDTSQESPGRTNRAVIDRLRPVAPPTLHAAEVAGGTSRPDLRANGNRGTTGRRHPTIGRGRRSRPARARSASRGWENRRATAPAIAPGRTSRLARASARGRRVRRIAPVHRAIPRRGSGQAIGRPVTVAPPIARAAAVGGRTNPLARASARGRRVHRIDRVRRAMSGRLTAGAPRNARAAEVGGGTNHPAGRRAAIDRGRNLVDRRASGRRNPAAIARGATARRIVRVRRASANHGRTRRAAPRRADSGPADRTGRRASAAMTIPIATEAARAW